jgi:hypothetical protein
MNIEKVDKIELRKKLRLAYVYIRYALKIGDEGLLTEEILDEIEAAATQLRYAILALDEDMSQFDETDDC